MALRSDDVSVWSFSLPMYLPLLLVWCTPQARWHHVQSHHLDCHVHTCNMNTVRPCINPHEQHMWPAQFNFETLTITLSALFSQFPTKFVAHLPSPCLTILSTRGRLCQTPCEITMFDTHASPRNLHVVPSQEAMKLVMHCLLLINLTWFVPTTFLPFTCNQTAFMRTRYIPFPGCDHQSAVSWFFFFTDGNNTCPLPVVQDLPLVSMTVQKW